MKLNWKNTFVIGFGFFAISLVWPIYNSYMPILYAKYIDSKAVIGGIMTIDNWLALSLTPLVGFLSDRTRTRFGRRIPYMLVGAPIAALFLFLIPFGWATSFGLLLTCTIIMNLAMASFRSPIVALMPDVTPSELRSRANGIINFMGGFGYIAATFGGSYLYSRNPGEPFYAAAVLLVAIAIGFLLWIREPSGASEQSERHTYAFIRDRNAIFMLLAILFWFISYNSLETWLTTYGHEYLGQDVARVARLLTYSGAAFLLMAIPAGFLAEGNKRWKGFSRKWTIMGGIVGMLLAFALLMGQRNLAAGWMYLVLAGVSWALININSYPMITQMAPEGRIGAYTGLYYLFSNGAMVVGPPLFGLVFDRVGYGWYFPLAIGFMLLAALCLMVVKTGEAKSGQQQKVAAAD
ncbi:MAG: MFS transporter [Mycobacterium leprae]